MAELSSWRWGALSRQFYPQTPKRLAYVGLVLLALVWGSLCIGKVWLSPLQVAQVLWAEDASGLGFIVEQLRLPRTLVALFVGAALGVSGLILQSIVRNPLASPDLLGVTSGASLAAVLYLAYFSTLLGSQYLPLAAMSGAALAAAAIYLLAWQDGASPLRLVLVGVGISALLAAATTFLLVFSPLATTLSAYVWLAGSVYGTTWATLESLTIWLLACLPLLIWLARQVRVQQLDDGLARGVGVSVQWLRGWMLLASVALAGVAVAWGGAIAFVGLIAPHIGKKLVAPGFAGQAMMTAMVGGALVLVADLIGRTLFLPADLPAGIFVAVLGTPFFLYLLIKQPH